MVDPAASNSDIIIDSAVTDHPVHTDNYNEKTWWQYTSLSNTHGEHLWFNSANTDTNVEGTEWLPPSNWRLSTAHSRITLQSFSRVTRSYALSGSVKHAQTSLAHSQDFSKNFWRMKIRCVMLRPARKQHCVSSSLASIISRHLCSRDLSYTLLGGQWRESRFLENPRKFSVGMVDLLEFAIVVSLTGLNSWLNHEQGIHREGNDLTNLKNFSWLG